MQPSVVSTHLLTFNTPKAGAFSAPCTLGAHWDTPTDWQMFPAKSSGSHNIPRISPQGPACPRLEIYWSPNPKWIFAQKSPTVQLVDGWLTTHDIPWCHDGLFFRDFLASTKFRGSRRNERNHGGSWPTRPVPPGPPKLSHNCWPPGRSLSHQACGGCKAPELQENNLKTIVMIGTYNYIVSIKNKQYSCVSYKL